MTRRASDGARHGRVARHRARDRAAARARRLRHRAPWRAMPRRSSTRCAPRSCAAGGECRAARAGRRAIAQAVATRAERRRRGRAREQCRHRRAQAVHGDRRPTNGTRMIDVNVNALYHVTRALLPAMIERGRGHVCTIGSIAGAERVRRRLVLRGDEGVRDVVGRVADARGARARREGVRRDAGRGGDGLQRPRADRRRTRGS